MTVIQILEEIHAERLHQDQKWGGPEHDDQHNFFQWMLFICNRSCKPIEHHNPESIRRHLVEIAALAVAAIEAFDRRYR